MEGSIQLYHNCIGRQDVDDVLLHVASTPTVPAQATSQGAPFKFNDFIASGHSIGTEPYRLLICNWRENSGNDFQADGNVPVSWLLNKDNVCRAVRLLHSSGSEPES